MKENSNDDFVWASNIHLLGLFISSVSEKNFVSKLSSFAATQYQAVLQK